MIRLFIYMITLYSSFAMGYCVDAAKIGKNFGKRKIIDYFIIETLKIVIEKGHTNRYALPFLFYC